MMTPTMKQEVVQIVARAMPADNDVCIHNLSRLQEDLLIDSMGKVEIAMDLELVFRIEVSTADMDAAETVADLCALVAAKQTEKETAA